MFEATKDFSVNTTFESATFLSTDNENAFLNLLSCEPNTNHIVDFTYLERHGIFIKDLFEKLSLTLFCTRQEGVCHFVGVKFYLNLIFPNRDTFIFTFQNLNYTVIVEALIKLIHHSLYRFEKIPISHTPIYSYIPHGPKLIKGDNVSLNCKR